MKTKITLLFTMTMLAGLASAQNKKPKAGKPGLSRDSVYAYQFVPKKDYGNPLMLTMPIDTLKGTPVKMPNYYRKGPIEPVPMPTHKVELVKPK